MKNLFGINNIAVSSEYAELFSLQHQLYSSIADIISENQQLSQYHQELVELSSLIGPYKEFKNILKQYNLKNIQNIVQNMHPIKQQMNFPLYNTQTVYNERISSLKGFSDNIESIRSEHLLERCVEEIDSNEENSEISSEEMAEAYNDLTDLSKDTRNWQQKLAYSAQKWKEKNPVICFFLVSMVLAIFNNILSTPFTSAIPSNNNARIKDEPSANGNIIFNLSVNQEVTIISNTTNYYYEIEFYDEETCEWKKGWISKRSVKINKETSESEPDDTEEESE